MDLSDGWPDRWTATWKYAGDEITGPVRHLQQVPVASRGPMRGFTWRREQRHRPGLESLVSTGRLHGFESLEEDQLLVAVPCAHVMETTTLPAFGRPFSAYSMAWRVSSKGKTRSTMGRIFPASMRGVSSRSWSPLAFMNRKE